MRKLSRGGCLSSFILISYIAMTTSVTLDLTELKNKISQLKVNPRGNLWATGHFMGKKSVDSSFLETVFENIDAPSEDRGVSPVARVEDVRALITKMLKGAQQTRKQTLDIEGGDPA
ncbi:neuromedin Ba [Fundulus heteroclitus]|uniref:Neuromedin-B n=1 Tax=Fundulus heteroclitus TaxID=8078 RepID=A0A3Q2Q832_FUNHE|nr:neuromedin Ba [Fundulus heteroclitus]